MKQEGLGWAFHPNLKTWTMWPVPREGLQEGCVARWLLEAGGVLPLGPRMHEVLGLPQQLTLSAYPHSSLDNRGPELMAHDVSH